MSYRLLLLNAPLFRMNMKCTRHKHLRVWSDTQGFGSCLVHFLPASSIFNLRLVSQCHFALTEKWKSDAALWHRVRLGLGDGVDPAVVVQGGFVLKHIELADWTDCSLDALCPVQCTPRPCPRADYEQTVRCSKGGHENCLDRLDLCDCAGGACPGAGGACPGAGPARRQLFYLEESLDQHLADCVDLDFLKCLWTPRSLVIDIEAVRTRSSKVPRARLHALRQPEVGSPEVEVCPRYQARILRYLNRGFRLRDVEMTTKGNRVKGVQQYGVSLYSFSYEFEDPGVDAKFRDFLAQNDKHSLESLELLVCQMTAGLRATGREVRRVQTSPW